MKHWNERKAAQKTKKDHNRRYSRNMLERMGYKLTDLPSKRVLIEHDGKTIYFVLGTGSWNCIEPTRAALAHPSTSIDQQGGAPALLNVEEMAALRRFNETCEDGEGYDVRKPMMQRLASIGAVRRTSGSYYEITDFGMHALGAAPAPAAQADMILWLSDDNEVYANGPDDFANDYARNCMCVGDDVTVDVDCAHRRPRRTMRIILAPKGDDDCEVLWKWVDDAAMSQAKGEKS